MVFDSDCERSVVEGAVARLRKMADELESGKIRTMSFERFRSHNSPNYMEYGAQIAGSDSSVVMIGWMEPLP